MRISDWSSDVCSSDLACLGHAAIARVAVAIHPEDSALYRDALGDLEMDSRLTAPIAGGATRQDSVRLGLEALSRDTPQHVLIHDAARPFLQHTQIDALIDRQSVG